MKVATSPTPANYGAAHHVLDGACALASGICFHRHIAGQYREHGLRGSMHLCTVVLKLKLAEKMISFG